MIGNNTITPHAVAQGQMNTTVLFMMVAANVINILSIVAMIQRHLQRRAAAAPPAAPPVHWIPVGWFQDKHLYQRTYPSGKHAWRFAGDDGDWIYPRRSDVVYWGRRHDNETPLIAAAE